MNGAQTMRIGLGVLVLIGGLGACVGAALMATRGQEPGATGTRSAAASSSGSGTDTAGGQDPATSGDQRLQQNRAIDRSKPLPLDPVKAPSYLGDQAFVYAEKIVALGPRYAGRPGWSKQLDLIEAELKKAGLTSKRDTWTDRKELLTFTNLWATIPGKSKKRIVLACHHDTKCTQGHPEQDHNFHFVGANDGASGVAVLLALAPILQKQEREATIDLVFFDGEESLDWNWNDAARALFGSKRFARKHREALLLGEEARIEAVVLLDMVGRTDLHIQEELYSTERMREIVWGAAVATGHQQNVYQRAAAADDDHSPFLRAGIPAVDLIDLDGNPYWHTPMDTIENMSPKSLQITADLVLTMLPAIEREYVTKQR
ncbi:MAG: M28 family metallopeptidase [Planctomycetota bacterium]